MDCLRDLLKQATATQHAELDASSPLSQPALTLETYTDCLERLWGYYAQLEPGITSSPHLETLLGLPMRGRSKLQWLSADLCWLHGIGTAVDCLPRCERVPRLASPAAALGCAYVLEGATLGGWFLYGRFKALWGLTEHSGGRFLHGYGTNTGPMWREFTTALNAVRLDGESQADCIAAARSTFSHAE